MVWIREFEAAQNIDDLAKIATALKKTAQEDDQILRGRQIAHMIYEHFSITSTIESVLEVSDL